MSLPASQHSVGVGGWVVRADGCVLLVRMTYGPAKGRLMIPGGHLDPGELLHETATREVREETGVEAEPLGILMVRQRREEPLPNLYFVFAMRALSEATTADGNEVSEVVWLSPDRLLARDDLQPIARETAQAWVESGDHHLAARPIDWQDPADYRLWLGA
ncbi:MAG: NUDIX hydrolase [Armatimonadetes bacterium]|nr:NUDIX hydrolase [Armatimonadota bacterium]